MSGRKVMAGSMFIALVPLSVATRTLPSKNVSTTESSAWSTHLVLAEKSPDLLVPADTQPKIEVADSRYDEEQKKLAAEAAAKAKAEAEAERQRQLAFARAVQAASQNVVNDVPESQKVELATQAANQYGIPPSLLIAVGKIESGFQWYTCEESSAGAKGPFQFMPGTFRSYAVPGKTDICSAQDAAFAAARLLAANGANQGNYRKAALAYNHAGWYADRVLAMAGLQ